MDWWIKYALHQIFKAIFRKTTKERWKEVQQILKNVIFCWIEICQPMSKPSPKNDDPIWNNLKCDQRAHTSNSEVSIGRCKFWTDSWTYCSFEGRIHHLTITSNQKITRRIKICIWTDDIDNGRGNIWCTFLKIRFFQLVS
jgi:hypothetical protein